MKIALFVIILVLSQSQNAFAEWQKKFLAVALVASGGTVIYAAKGEDERVRNALVSIGAGLAIVGITYLWRSGRDGHGMEKFDKHLLSRFSHFSRFQVGRNRLQTAIITLNIKPNFKVSSGQAKRERIESTQGFDNGIPYYFGQAKGGFK